MNTDPTETDSVRHWRVERADEFSLIVDASDYFKALRKVIRASRQQLLLVGWDFDLEIEMLPGESDADGLAPDGLPNKLGPFLEKVVEVQSELHIYMLKWNGSVLVAPGRLAPTLGLAVLGSERIHLALDGHHPFGACHHQKIVVADDQIAFCGGIDATESRWDTSEHLPDDPRRVDKKGEPTAPWHDVTSSVSGPAAAALGNLSRHRWLRARGETLAPPTPSKDSIWPDDLRVDAENIDVAIARTEPPFDGAPLRNEIEEAFLAGIREAKHTIYIESQYFAAETVCAAIEARLSEENGPQVVVINPEYALSEFEDDAMHELRDRAVARLIEKDVHDHFRIYFPVTVAGQPIYVHAKVFIVDGVDLHIGSANMNNRSMGFDTECNVIVMAQRDAVSDMQDRLLAEHLGVSQTEFRKTLEKEGTLIDTIGALNGKSGRRLRDLKKRPSNMRSAMLADTRLMDPRYHPNEDTSTGQGIRPRHLGLVAGAVALGWIIWKKFR